MKFGALDGANRRVNRGWQIPRSYSRWSIAGAP